MRLGASPLRALNELLFGSQKGIVACPGWGEGSVPGPSNVVPFFFFGFRAVAFGKNIDYGAQKETRLEGPGRSYGRLRVDA